MSESSTYQEIRSHATCVSVPQLRHYRESSSTPARRASGIRSSWLASSRSR